MFRTGTGKVEEASCQKFVASLSCYLELFYYTLQKILIEAHRLKVSYPLSRYTLYTQQHYLTKQNPIDVGINYTPLSPSLSARLCNGNGERYDEDNVPALEEICLQRQ